MSEASNVIEMKASGSALRYDPLIWLADLTYTQQTVAADVMPNAVGCIATFTETRVNLSSPIRLFKYPEKLSEDLGKGPVPGIIGFSNYVWNFDLSYRIAKAIKRKHPQTIIVFGGPNYPTEPDEQELFLRRHPAIDFYIVKEGELAFSRVLEALIENGGEIDEVKRKKIPSVHSILSDGLPVISATIERITDLTEIPSPYATGRMDEFFDGILLPIIQTNRGCPFECTFCVEGVGYYNKVYKNSTSKITDELDYIGAKMKQQREKGGRNDLFIADSNFGMYKDDLDTCRELSRTQREFGWPEYINVATGKNRKERVLEASRLLDGALRLSGSVQSLDEGVLLNIKRKNISADGLLDLAMEAGKVGANTYSEIILGLPGDSIEAHLRTIRLVMDAGFTNIYLFQLMLLPGTELATNQVREQYGMTVRHRVLPRCYGHFDVLGERVVAAEIEDICVANNTLSFEEYLECRRLHLVITIFHNDGIFGTMLKLLRLLEVPVFRWMEIIMEGPLSQGLEQLFQSFHDATRNELWDSREELEEFIQQEDVVEKFISGELGNNLLFVHKTLAITHHIEELAELAQRTIAVCLDEAGKASEEVLAFVNDALRYHVCRAENLFFDREVSPAANLSFDIKRFEEEPHPENIREFRLSSPKSYRFTLDNTQNELIDRYLGIYGDSTVGIGRILSKVYVRKLFRHPLSEDMGDISSEPGDGENRFRIAGLQN